MQAELQQSKPQIPFIGKSRFLWLIPFLVLSVIFLLILSKSCNLCLQEKIALRLEPWSLIAILTASIGFILCKASAFYFSARATGVKIGFIASAKLLTQSVLIEITMFPSKVAGDTYKYFRLPGKQQKRKVAAVMVFRCSSFLPFFLLLFFYPESVFSWLFCSTLLIITAWLLLKKVDSYFSWSMLSLAACGHILALLIWALQSYLLLKILSNFTPGIIYFIGIFLMAQVASAASNLPFGLGVKEIFFSYTLSSFLGVEQLILFLILQRLSGELLTAFIGWLTMLPDIFQHRILSRPRLEPESLKNYENDF